MASTQYDNILREAEQLSLLERIQLSIALSRGVQVPSGADFIATMKTGEQLDSAIVDEMEQLIEEGCEQIDPRTW